QPQETVLRVQRQHLVLALLRAPRLELDGRLIANALERFARAARRLLDFSQVAELLERVDVEARAQLLDLQPADSCDEAQVIVGTAARIALNPPVADVAMLRGLGVGDGVALGE